MLLRTLALAALGLVISLGAHADDKKPPKVIVMPPVTITVVRSVAAPVVPGNGKRTVTCDAKHRCSVSLS
jgi:hypothetical protein